MLAHFLAVLALLGSALLVVLGLGVSAFALARGNRRLARRAAIATVGYTTLYLLGAGVSAFMAPRRVLPLGEEVSFCGFDCHLHVSVLQIEMEDDRIGLVVRARSDARGEPEFPSYLQFRLMGSDGSALVPLQEGTTFAEPLAAGTSALDTLTFVAPLAGTPYALRVIYPDLPEALLLGPANSRGAGRTTLGLGDAPS